MADIRDLLAELTKRIPPGAKLARGRIRLCARCVKLKDTLPELEHFTPRPARTWVDGDRRYFAALCADCAEFERTERDALRTMGLRKAGPR